MSYSRRFAFFDKVELNIEKDERAFQDLPVTCVSSGGGYLWLGDVDGFMHCLDATFMFASFRAHNAGPVRLCRQVPGVESHLVVTVGVSSDDSTSGMRKEEERVCVWNTKKWSLTSKTSFPVCCRSVRTTATTAATASATLDEVVCLEVASTMDTILLGHTSGAVQLIKGDINSDRQCRRLILHEFPSPVTNLHYVAATPTSTTTKRHKGRHVLEQTMPESDSGSVSSTSPLITKPTPSSPYIYAASENKLVSIKLGKKDEPVRTTILDTFGCRPNCSCLVADPENPNQKNLAMAHKEAVYFYDPDGRGPCLAIVGNKQAIAVYKNYLVSIRCNRPEANQLDFPDAQSSVSLFEYRNKFIGGEFFLPWAHSIITGFGGLFVLCVEEGSKVKIVELIEKDTQSMLDILFARKSFNLALGIAESDNYSEEELAHIHRRYADHLFNQKQYDLAVKEYIQTIGTVEASYVVLRFLESGLITHLVRYLEALIESGSMVHGRLTKDHTALLLNSYARLDDRERIDAFLDRLASQATVSSEFYPCINVLRRAGYPHQALRLAQITNNHTDCIRILTEDLKDAVAALKEINSLPFDQSLEAVCTHGAFLMQNAPSETAELLDGLCSNPKGGRISASQFIKIFVNNRLGLMKFLERYIEKSTSTDACLTDVVETLLELLLHEVNEVASNESAEDKDSQLAHLRGLIMRLLEDPKVTYDEGKALILCKQRNFLPGCLYIWMKNKLYDQIMEHYILEDNFEAILKACEEYGDEVPSLWFEAFKYAADKPQLGEELPRLLSEIESRNLASPLVVLRLLTSPDADKCHTLGSVKAYFLHYLESGKEKVEANEAEMQRLREETLRNREIARQSKTRVKIFQQQKCAVCNQALEPPSVHFLCDHSYHKSCFDTYSSDDQLCPECAPLIRRGLMEASKTTSQLPTMDSADLLAELEQSLSLGKVNLSTTLSKAIAKGVASQPSSISVTKIASQPSKTLPSKPSLPKIPPSTSSKTPFDDLPAAKAVSLGDSGRGESLPSGVKQPSAPSVGSTFDSGVVLPTKKVSKVALNPFGEDDDEVEADTAGKRVPEVTDEPVVTYPQHLNPF
ncbi:vacuolar protein sorting associated protein 11 [Echinococcus multilocularis]|uniref:Vacuolar protein sorting associated protein 11 n=1 Tax=Echinococcus multilocularis TaxID=6211 RepID=A0A068YBV8_ECHMU|nr:vacuolar protein sorting associated protein 11 [Echinococcus multilocularis]